MNNIENFIELLKYFELNNIIFKNPTIKKEKLQPITAYIAEYSLFLFKKFT